MKKLTTNKTEETNKVTRFLRSAFQPIDEKVAKTVKQTSDDFRNSVLVVSLAINLFVLTTWLVLEATNVYNAQIISYLQQ